MAIKNRKELKSAFKKGNIPTQDDFENLIDSLVHKHEDGLFDENNGICISSSGASNKLVSFCESMNKKNILWSLEQNTNINNDSGLNLVDKNGDSLMYINNKSFVGIGNVTPQCKLDVNGEIQTTGRRGTYKYGRVLGDGKWHVIIDQLSDCHVFEIVAKINKYNFGRHSIIHAIAANAFNGKGNKINITNAFYGDSKNSIDLCWDGEEFNYNLKIRTTNNYDGEFYIEYYITNLWW